MRADTLCGLFAGCRNRRSRGERPQRARAPASRSTRALFLLFDNLAHVGPIVMPFQPSVLELPKCWCGGQLGTCKSPHWRVVYASSTEFFILHYDIVFAPVLQEETNELIPLEDVLPACMAEFVVPPPDAGRA